MRAKIQGVDHEVRVTRDLADNWAVEIAPIPAQPRRFEVYKPYPALFVLKLKATSREAATLAALELLKQQGRIQDFTA